MNNYCIHTYYICVHGFHNKAMFLHHSQVQHCPARLCSIKDLAKHGQTKNHQPENQFRHLRQCCSLVPQNGRVRVPSAPNTLLEGV